MMIFQRNLFYLCIIFTETPKTIFGFCEGTHRLVDIHTLLEAAKAHSLPGLGVCLSREQLMQSLRKHSHVSPHAEQGRIIRSHFIDPITLHLIKYEPKGYHLDCLKCPSFKITISVFPKADTETEANEFMNSKKSHEVQSMSEVVSCLAQGCRVNQVDAVQQVVLY